MDTFVRQYKTFDVNVMVGVGDGLVAPVVRDVGGRGLHAISSEVKALASKAQAGELEAHQVRSTLRILGICFSSLRRYLCCLNLGKKREGRDMSVSTVSVQWFCPTHRVRMSAGRSFGSILYLMYNRLLDIIVRSSPINSMYVVLYYVPGTWYIAVYCIV